MSLLVIAVTVSIIVTIMMDTLLFELLLLLNYLLLMDGKPANKSRMCHVRFCSCIRPDLVSAPPRHGLQCHQSQPRRSLRRVAFVQSHVNTSKTIKLTCVELHQHIVILCQLQQNVLVKPIDDVIFYRVCTMKMYVLRTTYL